MSTPTLPKDQIGDPADMKTSIETIETIVPITSTTLIQTSKQLLTERIQFITLCWGIIVTGWNDGSTGPLLPRIQLVYDVRPFLS